MSEVFVDTMLRLVLLTGKCCTAHVKLTTVPRLELLACILLSKLIVSIKKAVAGLLNVRNVFVGQIRRFCCGGSDRVGKIGRFGSKIEFRLFRKM